MSGIECPSCLCEESGVADSRPSTNSVRRRRRCASCGYSFSTVEVVLVEGGLVVKSGVGQRAPVVQPLPVWLAEAQQRVWAAVSEALR